MNKILVVGGSMPWNCKAIKVGLAGTMVIKFNEGIEPKRWQRFCLNEIAAQSLKFLNL